jgi:hypothetical protein
MAILSKVLWWALLLVHTIAMSPWPLPRSFTSGSECLWLAEDVRLDIFVAPASLERLRYISTINSQEAAAEQLQVE